MCIRIMIVEDDPFWQNQLATDLSKEPDLEVVSLVGSKEEALSQCRLHNVDVVLMDINLSENNLDGMDTAKEILRRVNPDLKVIMLTSILESDVIIQSFQSGAVNYITKSSYKDIVQAIRDAYHNRASIHSDAAAFMRSEIQLMLLTPMEREVYELKKKGFNRTEIAEKLNKSINTIRTQVRSIRDKLKKT